MTFSRRKFVKSASAAVALTAIGSRAEALTNVPEILVSATAAYREEMDPVKRFLAQRCVLGRTLKSLADRVVV